jgi:hypothetical protein
MRVVWVRDQIRVDIVELRGDMLVRRIVTRHNFGDVKGYRLRWEVVLETVRRE